MGSTSGLVRGEVALLLLESGVIDGLEYSCTESRLEDVRRSVCCAGSDVFLCTCSGCISHGSVKPPSNLGYNCGYSEWNCDWNSIGIKPRNSSGLQSEKTGPK
ncbi:hypothetical protein RJZ90_002407 [Blastomyces dermatitidis]